ncbi:MBL fold metallo-hydrolase [Roseateles sp. BYS180W]|uniref:MBL fold metallo-hydrolase n=1 Tax=Roseateles rivi TaxID=3299028 RepID=A0ABW7FTF9_9BURK
MALHYTTLPVTPFAQNCSLLWCEQTREAALVDAGGEHERLLAEVAARGLTLKMLLVTHAHIDHAGAVGQLAREQGLPVVGPHVGDQFWIDGLAKQSAMFGFPPAEPFVPTRWLEDGDTVQLGQEVLAVRHCPGHTPGHVVFHSASAQRCFVGDVLFVGSIGRTDFPGGNHEQLLSSIRERLWPMGDEVVFIPGHGPEGTLGHERRTNPFLSHSRWG